LVSPGIKIALKQTVETAVVVAMRPKATNEIDNKFFIDTFLKAAHNKAFHHQ
jgi:hypothetical protein